LHDAQAVQYVFLLFALSVPVWLVGGGRLPGPLELPVSALMAFLPAVAAAILTYRRSGLAGLRAFLGGAFDYRRIRNPAWYVPILLLNPLIMFLSYVAMRVAGLPLPPPQIPLLLIPVYALVFFPPAVAEELGWMGFAIEPHNIRNFPHILSLRDALHPSVYASLASKQEGITRPPGVGRGRCSDADGRSLRQD
jgi:hypothetical protein